MLARPYAFIALAVLLAAPPCRAQSPDAPSPTDPFFDDSVLQEVRLSINSRDWQALHDDYMSNAYYPADFRWGSAVVRNVGIRSRGTSSRSGVKPGLRVDFNRYVSDQTFLGLKSFDLRNNTLDASGMHESISMQLFRRMGIPAPREAHTRVYVNNQFVGLYAIVEAVNKSFLMRVKHEDGGYLYKFDRNVGDVPWYFESRGTDPDLYVPHPFKPETHEIDPWPEKVAELVRIINDESDTLFRSAIAPFLDLERFVKHIAVETFLTDTDDFNGNWGMNNFYLYRLEHADLFELIPWDKDQAFKGEPDLSIWHNILDVPDPMQNRLMRRVVRDPELRGLFLDALEQCARAAIAPDPLQPGDLRGWMEREIDREYRQISDSTAVAEEDLKHFSRGQFEQEITNLKNFARHRAEFVLAEVARSR